jgi:linoleoyl-CoA desaturase
LSIQYAVPAAFRNDLETEVAAYFKGRGLSRKGSAALWLKTAVLAVWLVGSYGLLVFVATQPWQFGLLAASLACAMAGIGFNVQHDGGHGSYATSASVNRGMAFSLDLMGGSSYFWRYKHGIAHHGCPNIAGFDDDVYLGPLGRLTPYDRRFWFHRFQHLYVWLLYGMLAIKWQLVDDFHSIIKPGVASTVVPRPAGGERLLFWSGKVLFFGFALILPMFFHSWWGVLAVLLLTDVILGILLSVVFQLAHCLGEATFAKPPLPAQVMDRDWATHQVEATVDFAHGNRALTWFIGGLNFQIEHHLFPRVCHTHYPALSKIVERVCRTHGIRYTCHSTASAALGSHYRWLRQMGQGDSPTPVFSASAIPAASVQSTDFAS